MGRPQPVFSSPVSRSAIGDYRLVERRCDCPEGGRRQPLGISAAAAKAIARAGVFNSSTPVLSVRCKGCKQILQMTAGDLGMADAHLRVWSS